MSAQLCNDLNPRRSGDFVFETLEALDDRFDFRMIDDGNFTFAAERLDNRLGCQFSAGHIVRGNVCLDFGVIGQAGYVSGEDRDTGIIGSFDSCADGAGITGADSNGVHFLDDAVPQLIFLFGNIEFARRNQLPIAVQISRLLQTGFQFLVERVRAGQQADADLDAGSRPGCSL